MHRPYFIFYFLLIISCNSINVTQEKEQIQTLINQVTAAHFEKDGTKFYAPNASEWWDIRGGQVTKISKETAIPNTQSYLDNMEFLELRESQEPIIEISADGSMASYIGAIHLKGRYAGQPIFWVVSWQSILKKEKGNWQIIQTANTEMPEKDMAVIILEKAKEALGKDKKVANIQSIYTSANCKGPTGNFTTILMSNKSNARFEQKNGDRTTIIGINENKTWLENAAGQITKENLDTLTQLFVHGHELHWLSLHPETRFQQPVFKGFKTFENKTAFEIEFTDALKRPVLFYYDFENYQPLGFVIYTNSLATKETVAVYYKKWEELDGIFTFKRAIFQQGTAIFEYDFSNIEWNQLSKESF